MFYNVFCTCVSKNTVKHTQKATFWSENAIQPMLFHHFRAEQCKTHGSLTEVSSKGSHLAIKEGNTQKHTQSVKQNDRQPAADRKGCCAKRLKNKGFANLVTVLNKRNVFIWKNNCFSLFLRFFAFSHKDVH